MVYEIKRFGMVYYGRKSEYYTIQQISILATYIQTFGISHIRQIIFEFTPIPYFPYKCHNISLCNIQKQFFVVQFYHYYNSSNELIVLHKDTQKQDYHTLLQFLHCHPILQQVLIPYIHQPFTNDLKEYMY